MRALTGAVALSLVLLTGCGDSPSSPAPTAPTSTVTQDVAPTSAEPSTATVTDADVTTATAATSSEVAVTSTDSTPAPTATSTGPTAPVTPAASGCTGDALSQDILGFTGGVSVLLCEGEWAQASYPDAPGAPDFIAERADGRWLHAVTIGDPVCKDDLIARGAPLAIATLMPLCAENPAPTAPTTPAPDPEPTGSAGDCVIATKLYGQTHAELAEVTCADATAEWEVAEANNEPSWTIPWVTPTGWECFVTPYDPTTKAAGSCYGPDGTAYFTLYLP